MKNKKKSNLMTKLLLGVALTSPHRCKIGAKLPNLKNNNFIRKARRSRAAYTSARVCNRVARRRRVQECATEPKLVKRGQARRCRAASLAMLCNTFIVETYTHRRGGKTHDRVSSRASDTRY